MSQPSDSQSIPGLVFDSLSYIRENAKVFRKYFFLPCVLSISSVFIAELPMVGLAFMVIANALALALVGVSAARFTAFKNAERVADGVNRAFVRFFFVAFMLSALGHVGQAFLLLPQTYHGMALGWMLFMIWLNLKVCLAFPALALDHPGSVGDVLKLSLGWTQGNLLRIVLCLLICYSPFLFFSAMILNVAGINPAESNFFENLPFYLFSNIIIIFCMMWGTVVLTKIYQGVVKTQGRP